MVSPGRQEVADIGVRDGRIAQVGGAMTGREEIAADGLLALPGGVDAHVHLMYLGLLGQLREAGEFDEDEPGWVDDFWTGSLAAIGGGITTIGNMTFPMPGETPREAVAREMAAAAPEAAVDWFLHPVLTDLAAAADGEIAALAADGHASVKIFLTVPQIAADEPGLRAALGAAREAGSLTLIHCEAAGLLEECGEHLIAHGRGELQNFPEARPVAAEVEAVDQAAALATATGAPVYIVHLSSALALASARRAQAAGLPVFVETRPVYLHLTGEVLAGPDGGKYIGSPPLREPADVAALWSGLADGTIHTLGSDHAPWLLADKTDPALDVTNARQGVADLETLLPMLFSAGVATGRLSLPRFVELTSTAAARLFGLYPRKGTIAVGSDADLVVLDPQARRVIDGRSMQSRAGYSVYDGTTVTGWPRYTVSRGEVVLDGGEVTAPPGRGQWLRRDRTAAP